MTDHAALVQGLAAGVGGAYLCRVRCWNLFRRVAYFRSSSYIDWCEAGTIPVVRRSEFKMPDRDWERIEEIQTQYAVAGAAGRVVLALGVPKSVAPRIVSETIEGIMASQRARANAAQLGR